MNSMQPILLVEDDVVDAMTVERAMSDLNVNNSLVHVSNGEEALDYLRNDTNAKPCVILLDLNMPKMNGSEFLKIVKADRVLRGIPVIILTTSRDDQDKNECFDYGVAGYIVKPTDYEKFVQAMKILDLYWTLNKLPLSAAERADTGKKTDMQQLEQTVSGKSA